MEILTPKDQFREEIRRKREEFKANPDRYREIPGKEYCIVVCDLRGEPIPTKDRKRIPGENTTLRILPMSDRRGFITWDLE